MGEACTIVAEVVALRKAAAEADRGPESFRLGSITMTPVHSLSMPMAAFQLLVKLLLAVPGGELLKIKRRYGVGMLWATLVAREWGVCVSKR